MLTLAVLSPGLLFFLIVGFIGFVVVAAKRHQEKLDQAWQTSAATLDMSYSTRKASGVTQRKLVGEFRNLPAKVNTFTEGSGKSKKTYTRYRLRYPHLGLGIELTQQHFFSGLKSALTGRQDIQVGSKEFDDAVIVQGGSSREVIAFLTRERQLAIQRFLTSKRRGVITDDEASFITNGVADDATKIRRSLEALDSLALAIQATPDELRAERSAPRDPEPAIDLPDPNLAVGPGAGPDPLDEPLGGSQPASAAPVTAGLAGMAAAMGASLDLDQPDEVLEQRHADPAPEPVADPPPAPEPVAVTPPPPTEPPPSMLDEMRELAAELTIDPAQVLSSPSPEPDQPSEPEADQPSEPEADQPSEPEVEPPAPAAAMDYASVRTDLFQTDRMSYETKEHFEAVYGGREVRWRGTLKRFSSFSSDMVFEGSGVKATVELEPYMDGSFKKDVEAIVQLPVGTDADLKEHLGAEVILSGKLLACDSFMRKLLVADGLLEQA